MPHGHLIAATVMTLGICQDHSSIVSFFVVTMRRAVPVP